MKNVYFRIMTATITIDLISDIICPWCYIGKARLERAIEQSEGAYQFRLRVKPFLLYPHIPKGGITRDELKTTGRPGWGRLVRQEAEEAGVVIDYRKIKRIPNSLEAHRLLYLVEEDGLQYQLAKAMFRRYFEEGGEVEDREALGKLAKGVGVDDGTIGRFMGTEDGAMEVEGLIHSYKADNIAAVPVFVFNGEHKISGVQPEKRLLRIFSRL